MESSTNAQSDVVSVAVPHLSEAEAGPSRTRNRQSSTSSSSSSSSAEGTQTKIKLLQRELKKLTQKSAKKRKTTTTSRTIVVNSADTEELRQELKTLREEVKSLQSRMTRVVNHLRENFCKFCKRSGHAERECRKKAASSSRGVDFF